MSGFSGLRLVLWLRGALRCAGAIAVLLAPLAEAATVRGRIQATGSNAGVAGMKITLLPVGVVQLRPTRSAPVYTDRAGMFWMENVRPGSYSLEIWVNDRAPMVYRIDVREPVLDVRSISVGGS